MPSASQRALEWTAAGLVMAVLAGVCSAGELKTTAPKDVSLAGLWKINTELSDDPQKVIDQQRRHSSHDNSSGGTATSRSGRTRIGIPDAGEILGGIGGMGRPDRTDPADEDPRHVPGGVGGTVSRGTVRPHDREEYADPDHEQKMSGFVEQLRDTQELMEIEQRPDAVAFHSSDATNTCKPGETSSVMLPGSQLADRQCGWNNAAFVIEVKSKTGATRTDRYRLSNGGDRLTVTSTLSGSRGPLSGLEIKRVYDRAVAF